MTLIFFWAIKKKLFASLCLSFFQPSPSSSLHLHLVFNFLHPFSCPRITHLFIIRFILFLSGYRQDIWDATWIKSGWEQMLLRCVVQEKKIKKNISLLGFPDVRQ
ncbi:hypothetical protein BKA57DRAFT_472936 [Linnemannia elongata]|nr:hypothetical protein BKA57DRAFT_472936 [Linnemannia elongata]